MEACEQFLSSLSGEWGEGVISRWLRPLKVISFDAANLYLEAQDSFQVSWYNEHIKKKLHNEPLRNNNGRKITIHLALPQAPSPPPKPLEAKPIPREVQESGKWQGGALNLKQTESLPKQPRLNTLAMQAASNSMAARRSQNQFLNHERYIHGLDPELNFENFLVTEATELLYNLLQNIESSPYNPIYLYGPALSGKTHLLTATALFLQKQGKKVCYQKGEKFTEQVIQAMRNGQMRQLRAFFRSADVLLIDDVHHFARKFATQEEFFHTFNELHTARRPILLSSRFPPAKLEEIEPRLISRFEWGIPLEVTKIDAAQILQKKAELWHLPLASDLIPYLTEKFPASSLVALTALAFRAKLDHEITIPIAEKLLKDLLEKEKENSWTAEKILKKVADRYGIPTSELLGKAQTREIALPRQIAVFLCRELLKLPFQQIGRLFGRDP